MVAAVNLFRILNLFRSETHRGLVSRKTALASLPAVSRHYIQSTKPSHSRNKFFGRQTADSGPKLASPERTHTGASWELPQARLVRSHVSIRRTGEGRLATPLRASRRAEIENPIGRVQRPRGIVTEHFR
jgi:hypothetical protein